MLIHKYACNCRIFGMASKRQRGEGSGTASTPPPRFDSRRFVSHAAQERYNRMATRSLVPERGLRPDQSKDGDMAVMIAERNWFTLTEQPEPAVITVVKEFYANVPEHDHYTVFVRGKTVEIGEEDFNECYQLPVEDFHDEYAGFISDGPDYEQIIRELCQPGTTWTVHERGNMTFPLSNLSLYGKAWYAFICAKLMPCTHVSHVTRERAVLLYSIIKGYKINVGHLILQSVLRASRGSTTGGLPHPSLICVLCAKFGVKWKSDEMIQKAMPVLDHKLISRYKVWIGGANHPRGLGFIIPQVAPAQDPPPQAPPTYSPSTAAHRGVVPEAVQREIDGWFYNMESQNVRLSERQDVIFKFLVDQFAAQNALTVQSHPGVQLSHFPTAPVLPVFPPSDQEMSEDDDAPPEE